MSSQYRFIPWASTAARTLRRPSRRLGRRQSDAIASSSRRRPASVAPRLGSEEVGRSLLDEAADLAHEPGVEVGARTRSVGELPHRPAHRTIRPSRSRETRPQPTSSSRASIVSSTHPSAVASNSSREIQAVDEPEQLEKSSAHVR